MNIYADSWGMTLRVVLSTSACQVLGDDIQRAQVLSNLIRIAMEATEGQSERRMSESSRSTADDMVEVRIEDNGPGIMPKIAQNLFTAFSSSKDDGLGVGLSICRAIIEQHKGKIWAETLPNGTAFCFTLPAARGEKQEQM